MPHPAFIIKQAKSKEYFWNLTAKNGQVILCSGMYKHKSSAKHSIGRVASIAPSAAVVDGRGVTI